MDPPFCHAAIPSIPNGVSTTTRVRNVLFGGTAARIGWPPCGLDFFYMLSYNENYAFTFS